MERKVWRFFPGSVLYLFDTSEAEEMSTIRHVLGTYHCCVRCTISFENRVCGKTRLSSVLTAKTDTKGQVQILEQIAEMVSERGPMQGRSQRVGRIMRLHSQHSLAKCPSLLEDLSSRDGSVMRHLRFKSTFKSLHSLHFEVAKLLKTMSSSICHAMTCTVTSLSRLQGGRR